MNDRFHNSFPLGEDLFQLSDSFRHGDDPWRLSDSFHHGDGPCRSNNAFHHGEGPCRFHKSFPPEEDPCWFQRLFPVDDTFRLINSFPPAGTNDVPRTEAGLIQLRFSQDVTSCPAIWKHNKRQIEAFENLQRIPIKILRKTSCPCFIFVVIKKPLRQNTHYKVVIHPNLLSACGRRTGITEVVYYNTGPCVTIPG